ncbi:MAG: substrate-binding domain-containing protein [Chitinophagales bacterium]|nr:substrate-binding domain-containing protein [Chitinophagales bacterium]MDW8272840.1 substrate-binding domain-containing protein [Chitinophagales bacterium]
MNFYLFFLLIFSGCSTRNNIIKIKGSDTEVNLTVTLAEAFRSVYPQIVISVSGGGSGLGIASLMNGNADIANSSRRINEKEVELLRQKNLVIDSFIFAQDAIAIIVSEKNPFDSISVETIRKILSGEVKEWSQICSFTKPINIYGRQSNSGTYEYVKKILGIQFSPYAKQMNGNAQIIEALKADDSGIGYVSAGYVLKGNITGLKLLKVYDNEKRAVSPLDAEAIARGEYFFQRPLYQYFRKNDWNRIAPFIEFEKSETGKRIILKSGYYPLMTTI